MRVRGQRGRWPVRSTYPPGGGWGCKSWSLGPCFSDGRQSDPSRASCPPSLRLFSKDYRALVRWRRSGRRSMDRQESPRPHTRGRADRPPNLATFRARTGATSRVRRDAHDGPQRFSGLERVSQAGSARKMPGLGPDRYAQASERAMTGLPLGTQDGPHRGRRGIEGHFLRNKGLH